MKECAVYQEEVGPNIFNIVEIPEDEANIALGQDNGILNWRGEPGHSFVIIVIFFVPVLPLNIFGERENRDEKEKGGEEKYRPMFDGREG